MATPTSTQSSFCFDWTKCIFCQKHLRKIKTSCPADSKRSDVGSGYKSLSDVISGFMELGELPLDIKYYVPYWDDGDGMEASFTRHRACWHIKCRQRSLHCTKLERLQNRQPNEEIGFDNESDNEPDLLNDEHEPCPKRSRCKIDKSVPVCYFCDLPGPDLRKCMDKEMSNKVKDCAILAKDSMLVAKLVLGDMCAVDAYYHPSCILKVYYKAQKASRSQASNNDVDTTDLPSSGLNFESLALADVIAHIEDMKHNTVTDTPTVFKLSAS